MKRPTQILAAILGASALAIFPLLAPTYYVGLMIPFFAYAIALLGFNLLFGCGGLLSFGHAMFIGFGAYGTAVMAGVFGVKSFELVLAAVVVGSAIAAIPIWWRSNRKSSACWGSKRPGERGSPYDPSPSAMTGALEWALQHLEDAPACAPRYLDIELRTIACKTSPMARS